MKHFLVEVTYTVPLEKVLETRVEHREYLQTGYQRKWLLLSGAQSSDCSGSFIGGTPGFLQRRPLLGKGIGHFSVYRV
jgi:uncharacterized protein YciI